MHGTEDGGEPGLRDAGPWGMGGRRRHGMGMWGPPRGGWGGWGGERRRMRRGDIRTALLSALTDGPAHGYELIGRLEEKSGGMWRPSPGSVYPTLQLFEDEGLVRSEERDGKRVYQLTDAGRTEAADRVERFGATPWDTDSASADEFHGLMRSGAQLLMAAKQIARLGDPSQMERATTLLRATGKELYKILAED
jgi:DNA-binding PadR family transcriptional regulator